MRRAHLLGLSLFGALSLAACSGPIASNGGGGAGQNGVTVTPATPKVGIFGTQQFTATVTGSTNKAVTWQVNGVTGGSKTTGFISSTGLFVAPGSAPSQPDGTPITIMVTAVAQATGIGSGSTAVTVVASPNQSAQSGAVHLGTSGGNVTDTFGNFCCSGTLGSLVTRNGTQFILSNNHVLANSDFGTAGQNVSQPGLIENNCVAGTTVATLSEFFNLQTGQGTAIDAAIAQVSAGKVDPAGNILLLGATQTNGVPDPGAPHAGAGITATLNEAVAKSGRTTGLTCSTVTAIGMSASVDYFQHCGDTTKAFTANFTDLVDVTGSTFSASGDSGSLIVDENTADPVALLFGGNNTDTVGNAISDVLAFFTQNGGSATTFVGSAATHQVIGCTLPTKPANGTATLSASELAPEIMDKALAVRDAHGPELMAHPEVQAVGVGRSYDNPGESAILLFVTKGQPRTDLPAEVEGIRTRIVENDLFSKRGLLNTADSSVLEQSAAPPQPVYSIPASEVTRAKGIHSAHVTELMKLAGVQGVGITSSVDSPGEAALLIYFIQGAEHAAISPVIDGLRTRAREGTRFRAGAGPGQPSRGCQVPKFRTLETQKTVARKLLQ
jgi:hypothetical protein